MSRKKTHVPAASAATLAPAAGAPRRAMLGIIAALSAAAIGYAIYASQSAVKRPAAAVESTAVRPEAAKGLAAMVRHHDFGSISMAAGKVTHRYTISNVAAVPVTITGVSTSCMCTVATIVTNSGERSPSFGMPGHGRMPTVRETLAPGATALVEIVFDPAAHGPAGVGRIERTVLVDTDVGAPLELGMVAMVRP